MKRTIDLPDPSIVKGEILQKYPPKIARKRDKSILVRESQEVQEIQANVRTVPGIITQRGCCYAGCSRRNRHGCFHSAR